MERSLEIIFELIEEKKYALVREELLENNEADIAEIIEEINDELGTEKSVILFRMLPKDISAVVFAYLSSDCQVDIVSGITVKEVQNIMEEMSFDDMIDVLEELPANVVDRILMRTDKETRKLINQFLNYPESSAGSLMTIDYIGLKKEMKVRDALQYIKIHGMDQETVYTCYVMDGERHLQGIVSLRTLVVSESYELVKDLMHEDFISVNVMDDQEEVAQLFKKYDFLALPVVDKENRLVGIITFDDIMDVIEEETTEDFERMAGVMDDSDKEYLDISVMKHIKNRVPWLCLLTVSLMITGAIIARFELLLSQAIALVAYMPLLMGTGGNTGTQSATLIIRGMSLGEIELKDVGKVLWKEFRISAVIGIVLAIINFGKIMLIDGETMLVALTVSISILIVVVFAKLIGGLLPMAAKKMKIDPALMATPMISSITDMVSVVIYLLLATAIMGITI
ncbi:MAG: magnesium transporter [Clostridiales bacterium]|nr:magnesium transporter [Clostridiales bacterium]